MIINDISTLKRYISTIAGDDFEVFAPYVATADAWLREAVAGETLYALIQSLPDTDRLAELARRLVAFHAYERAIPFLDVVQTDNGFAVASTDKLAPASRERVNALLAATRTEQDNALEALQAYLEASPAFHAAWKDSPCYSLLTDTFIHSLKQFQRYAWAAPDNTKLYPKNRREFTALRGAMREATAFQIAPTVSAQLCDELIQALREGTVTFAQQDIIEPLRFALVNLVLQQPDKADGYLRHALARLKTNPEAYPAWANSAVGQAALSSTDTPNDQSIFFGF